MDDLCVGEIKAHILETEHRMIQDCMIWEKIDDDQECLELLSYISGINEMGQALLEKMCGDEDG